jgi:hypothetical protein
MLKNIEISGLQISDYRKRRPAHVAAAFAEMFALFEEGKTRPAAATEVSSRSNGPARLSRCGTAGSRVVRCCGCARVISVGC